jgi:ABC-type amino acid transport substrate-binding protein
MSFRFLNLAAMTALMLHAEPRRVRFCVEPNNLPFSNERLEGFENKLAAILAAELKAEPEFVWWAQRRGYIRNTVLAGRCDVLLGVPAGTEQVLTTAPYDRSAFALMTRKGWVLHRSTIPR